LDFNFVYITAGSPEEAERIGAALVEERLVACVNVLDGMRSIYRWRGRIERAEETVLIAKTRRSLVPAIVERVRSLHSYDCPFMVSLPILDGDPSFLAWIEHETRPEPGES
jgi:periplasmic divalent cation tolerance protein